MSKIEVDTIAPQSGTTLTVGESGDTITVPTGATFDASNATTTLPSTIVTTTGSQTLTNKTIDASQLTGTITPSDNTVSLAKLTATGTKDATTFLRGDNTFAEAGGGKVLQVVSTTKTDTFTLATSGNVFTDITGLSATITPSSASSKIYINFAITYGNSTGSIVKAKLLRGSTDISIGDANGSRQRATVGNYNGVSSVAMIQTMAQNFLDSPATTSATTYKLQVGTENGTLYVNRNHRNTDGAQDGTYTSSITLMEIGA